jgi:hypothetical protein
MSPAALLVLVVITAGCAAAPLERPMKVGTVDTGPGSLEQVRRQFAGTWELVSYDVYSAGGQLKRVRGAGTLTYDEYGNLTIKAEVHDTIEGVEPGLLQYAGRAVIDPVKSELRLLDMTGDGTRPTSELVAPSAIRHYRFDGPTLHISVVNERGEPKAVAAWKRVTPPGELPRPV